MFIDSTGINDFKKKHITKVEHISNDAKIFFSTIHNKIYLLTIFEIWPFKIPKIEYFSSLSPNHLCTVWGSGVVQIGGVGKYQR